MKATLLILAGLASLALSSFAVSAQESNRVPEINSNANASVDASVHTGVDEQSAQQPQPPPQRTKRQQPTSSHWGFQPATQPSATRFQPSQPAKLFAQPRNDDTLSTLFNPLTQTDTPTPSETSSNEVLKQGNSNPFGAPSVGSNKAPKPAAPSDPHSEAVRKMIQNLNSDSGVYVQDSKTKSSSIPPFARTSSRLSSAAQKETKLPARTSSPSPFSKSIVSGADSLKANRKSNSSKSMVRDKPRTSLNRQGTPRN
jgi:hypothetical protein